MIGVIIGFVVVGGLAVVAMGIDLRLSIKGENPRNKLSEVDLQLMKDGVTFPVLWSRCG